MKKEKETKGGGVGNVWIALSKTKDGLLLSEIFESQMTNKQLFDYYKKKGYVIIDSNIFKVTNKSVLDAFKDAVSKYIQEKYNESVDWQNTLLSYQIVGDRVVAQSCWVQTKNGNEYEVTPNDLVNKKFAKGGGVDSKSHILQSYTPKPNEQLVLIENFDGYSYKVYAVYVDGEYDRRIKVSKYSKGGKTDFGMLSVKAGIDNNPNPTYADKIAGAKMNKMAKGGGVGEYKVYDEIIIMDDDTKDAILDDEELQKFIKPTDFLRNKNSQTFIWIDRMEYDEFDKLANFLGYKYAKGGEVDVWTYSIGGL